MAWLLLLLSATPVLEAGDEASAVVVGAQAFGEYFPRSSVEVPGRGTLFQQSVLTGVRAGLGFSHRGAFRALLVVEAGYAAAGLRAGSGDDGFMVGVGAEGDWHLHRHFMPFVRLTGDFMVAQKADRPDGTLAARAIVLSVGFHGFRFFDFHACAGSDFAGGIAVGFGAGFGWQWAFETG